MHGQNGKPFVETEVSERVVSHLEMARRNRLLISIQGPPGVGKTTAALAYAEAQPDVWYYVARRDTSARCALFRELAARLAGTCDIRNHDNFLRIVQAAQYFGVRLLVLDEAQNLNADALEMIRSLYDEGGLSVALIGNHTFADQHNRERKALVSTPQFQSRLSIKANLGAVSTEDVITVARAHGITDAVLIKELALIARGPKGLRIVDLVATIGAQLAETPSPTSADHRAALTVLS